MDASTPALPFVHAVAAGTVGTTQADGDADTVSVLGPERSIVRVIDPVPVWPSASNALTSTVCGPSPNAPTVDVGMVALRAEIGVTIAATCIASGDPPSMEYVAVEMLLPPVAVSFAVAPITTAELLVVFGERVIPVIAGPWLSMVSVAWSYGPKATPSGVAWIRIACVPVLNVDTSTASHVAMPAATESGMRPLPAVWSMKSSALVPESMFAVTCTGPALVRFGVITMLEVAGPPPPPVPEPLTWINVIIPPRS